MSQPGLMRKLGAAGPVAIVLSFAPPLGGFILLASLTWLGTWLRGQHDLGWLVYGVATAVLIGLSIVPTFSVGILAGWAFGFLAGWPLSIGAIVVGSLLAYALGRGIARERVLEVIQERPKWRAVHEALLARRSGQTLLVVTLLRIPPASPFALTNFVLAAARVPLVDYTVGTLLGIAPRMALTVFVGAGLEQLRFKGVFDPWMTGAGVAALVVVCVVLGVWSRRVMQRLGTAPAPRTS